MLDSPLLPAPFELTDSLFDLTAEQLNILPDLKIAGTGDFNGDDKSDLLWRSENGAVVLWQMDGATQLAVKTIANVSTDWKIAGTGDFNGDDKSDLLWRKDNGSTSLWEMNGTNILAAGAISPNPLMSTDWKVAAPIL